MTRSAPRLAIVTADALPAGVSRYVSVAEASPGDVGALLELLPGAGVAVPLPASGRTLDRFAVLASVAFVDTTAARMLEPHLDALAILAEAGVRFADDGQNSWGVFAAEGPNGVLRAEQKADTWSLTGTKPWCSLGDQLTSALVTAYTGEHSRRLFRVKLASGGAPHNSVRPEQVRWVARGLTNVPSGPLVFDDAPAEPVGEDGWYLSRHGFAAGGIGVAACWWGASVQLGRAVVDAAALRATDSLVMQRVGRMVRLISAARLSLENAAVVVDAQIADAPDAAQSSAPQPSALAHAVRGTVVAAVDDVLEAVRDVLGPAALAFDESVARRHADLSLYSAQYHRLRDDASLGRAAVGGTIQW